KELWDTRRGTRRSVFLQLQDLRVEDIVIFREVLAPYSCFKQRKTESECYFPIKRHGTLESPNLGLSIDAIPRSMKTAILALLLIVPSAYAAEFPPFSEHIADCENRW